MEIIGWVQIAASPTLIGLFLGALIYFSNPSTTTFILGVLVVVVGIAIGIFWATRIWKTKGTVWFMSRIMATPELDHLKDSEEQTHSDEIKK